MKQAGQRRRICSVPVRVAVSFLVAIVLAAGWTARAGLPPAAPSHARASEIDAATSVGAKACLACHPAIHDAWTSGRHSRMIQPATPVSVSGDFSQGSLTLAGQRYRLRTANGEFFVTESYLTGRPQEHRVEYTLGSRRIQHYLVTVERGRIIVLPPSWDVLRHEWFDNMEIVRPDEDSGRAVQQWNKNCVGCHVSQQDNHYRPETQTYATEWADFGTSCERCHGPGSAHVQLYARQDRPASPPDRAIVRPTRLSPEASSMICAQCHSLRDTVAPTYRAGANYYDAFIPVLEYGKRKDSDPNYWADGRPRRFSNDAIGLWQSECFRRGGATCTTCHDPHTPDVDRHAALAATNNGLCTGCHQAIASDVQGHTHHAFGSRGSSCVECHMPKAVISIRSTMRDHTISVPAPENTVAFGIPNACAECHADKPPAWAVARTAEWWPPRRRAKMIARAEAFTAARAGRADALGRLIAIAADAGQGPLIQANAVGYLRNLSGARAIAALLAAIRSDHPAIRTAAASSLGAVSTPDGSGRTALLTALDDGRAAVRIAALAALINLGAGPFDAADGERFRRVSTEYAAAGRLRQDDAAVQTDVGFVHLLNGELKPASDALQNALALDPGLTRAIFPLALVRLGQGRVAEARDLLRRVPASDANYHAARSRLDALER